MSSTKILETSNELVEAGQDGDTGTLVFEDLGGDDDEITCLGNFSQTPEVLDISDCDDDIEQDSFAMIQGKIKNEPVEEEEDFDEKQSDASDLENHEDDEVEIIESDEELESSQQSLYKKMMRQEIKIKQEEKISSPFDNSEKNAMGVEMKEMVLKIPRVDENVIDHPSDEEPNLSDDMEIPDFDNDEDIPSFSSDDNISDHEKDDLDELENDLVIKPTKAKKRIRILDDDSDDESDKEADAPNEEPQSIDSKTKKGPKEPQNKKAKLSDEEEIRKHDQKDERESDTTNKKQSLMIDALPQPQRKAFTRGISSETIDKLTKKPETSAPSTSKCFQRSQ